MTTTIIASGAYVSQELSAEFGQLPPAFLPVGVKRLYEFQAAALGSDRQIYLTVPESYSVQPQDQRKLSELNITVLPVPEHLKLGESLVYALNYLAVVDGPLRLLHGDTLIEPLILVEDDVITVEAEGDDYSWAGVDLEGDRITGLEVIEAGAPHHQRPVVCGYFAFANSATFAQCVTRARGDFIAGLNLYCQARGVSARHAKSWYDFGHIQTYFRSRRSINTARSFNTVEINRTRVRKSSGSPEKLFYEAEWLSNVPPEAKVYTARLLDRCFSDSVASYDTEYQYCPTLSELYVFSSIGKSTWKNILSSCADFLDVCAANTGSLSADAHLRALTVDKTIERLEQYARDTGFKISAPTSYDGRPMPSLAYIVEDIASLVDLNSGRRETLMHGDFCFSNVLYNSRAGRIVVIDPRGYVQPGAPTVFGDIRYDLAKLNHSVLGNYDHILAGRYALQRESALAFELQFETNIHHAWLVAAVSELRAGGLRAGDPEIIAITISLFLSMLPLHADRPDRQGAFIANALRLYQAMARGLA